jgi:hypothetical protein
VGDRTRIWAEGGNMTLPNSNWTLESQPGYTITHSLASGNRAAFWTMFLFPMHLPTLNPDIRVQYAINDYLAL